MLLEKSKSQSVLKEKWGHSSFGPASSVGHMSALSSELFLKSLAAQGDTQETIILFKITYSGDQGGRVWTVALVRVHLRCDIWGTLRGTVGAHF